MRRKTKAQRVLDYENEEEEQKTACFGKNHYNAIPTPRQNGSLKRRKTCTSKEESEDDRVYDGGLHMLDAKLDRSSADLYTEGPLASESEEAQYLQTYSKKELIAMVLCMQREMEDLKEQLRCLTACGKLARNLETLIEKTQMWSNGNKVMPVSQGSAQGPSDVDAETHEMLSSPAVDNRQWHIQGPGLQKPHKTTHKDGIFSEVVDKCTMPIYTDLKL
ncbi:hypothetical protein DNTS_028527 [Danionella cerebrum]|uniref:Uncharacterized protein n=1 Tax=Danionella cerebrum TaxID=2873325 RepID=A0A553QM55_9TELE|nr:hypothetical protein DNTS_028527 [Danionella translucida]